MSNRNDQAVTRWTCPTCGAEAVKKTHKFTGGRPQWFINHQDDCTEFTGSEHVGPVTSVNDPDNAYFVVDD